MYSGRRASPSSPESGVVEDIVEQRERPRDVDLAALVVADHLLRDRERLDQLPEEPDVQVMLGPLDGAVVELLRRQ